jgi:tRNA 5-methylaminomethyl-2-thiouridine biosynthesis bifunctional protein
MSIHLARLGASPRGHAPSVPYSPLYDDLYHAESGAWAQARDVFIAGSRLPDRWQGHHRFVILETGFGLGNNFLATWAAWRADPARCERLVFISIEKHPLSRHDMQQLHAHHAQIEGESQGVDLSRRLIQAWPALTPGLHVMDFDEPEFACPGRQPRVQLILCLGDVQEVLPRLMAQVDAFYLDGFSPSRNPEMWDPRWVSRLHRLAAPGATAATWTVARVLRNGLTQAGFQVSKAPGFASKRDRLEARYQPAYQAPQPPGGLFERAEPGHAVILGAGLAGCAAAWALCREGWQVTLLDRHDEPAQEASGNPGGMFHSILHGEDGIHARAHRAAALQTATLVSPWMEAGRLPGQCQGLIRLDAQHDEHSALALLDKLGLPSDHVSWLTPQEARDRSGLDVPCGGWLFHQGGWLSPKDYASVLLQEAQATGRLTWVGHAVAQKLNRQDHAWQVLGDDDQVLAQGNTLILANAHGIQPLLDTLPQALAVAPMPMGAVRGQISRLDAHGVPGALAPQRPVAGSGYALRLADGSLLCGATSHHHDPDPAVREADHRHNLKQAARLGAWQGSEDAPLPEGLQGRVGWRATTADRLPLVGALPLPLDQLQAMSKPVRLEQPRLIPRRRDAHGGLFIMSGLGSRGITWAALAARLLAHWVSGSPCPVETDLRDAMDPARWLSRQASRQQGGISH